MKINFAISKYKLEDEENKMLHFCGAPDVNELEVLDGILEESQDEKFVVIL